MTAESRPFGSLFAEATRNGINRPKAVRGAGVKMVNMGELFAFPRLRNAAMDRVPFDESEARFLLKGGDLLFARQSLVLEGAGKCSLFIHDVEPVTFESHITRVRLDQSKADPTYYFYYLQSHHGRSAIRSIVEQGAGASGIRGSDLESLEVQWRPLHEQRAIAYILGTLDDKIELNQRMNETLEEMARALFKSWFFDFDPVRRKAEGRDPALPKHLADLFPSRFVDSALGEIPEGWGVQPADALFEISIGKTPPRKETHWFSTNPTDLPWMSIRDLSNCAAFIADTSEFLTREAVERFRVRIIPDETVVLSFKLTVGRVAITDGAMLSNEAIAHFVPRPSNSMSAQYTYCYLRSFRFDSLGSTSSIATAVNSDSVRAIPMVVPWAAVGAQFQRATEPIFRRIRSLQRESKTLANLRDALLPKLISGELRVKDAGRFIATVTA